MKLTAISSISVFSIRPVFFTYTIKKYELQ